MTRKEKLSHALVAVGALSRLLPHPPNMTAVGAFGVFSGRKLKSAEAYLLPLACMLITDPLLAAIYGFAPFSWITPFIYASLLINVFIGRNLATSAMKLIP